MAPAVLNDVNATKLLYASYKQGKHDAFITYLKSNPTVQTLWFNNSLCKGLQLVSSKKRTLSDVLPTLTILLQYVAKWTSAQSFYRGRTPYHVVCLSNDDHLEILKLVIKEFGLALINAQDDLGRTALMCAVQSANIKCLKELIANGADVNLMGNPLRDVPSHHRYKYKLRFGKKSTSMVGPLIDSINLMHPESVCPSNIRMDIFDLLLDNGVDVNQPCLENKRTTIEYAFHVDNAHCVKKLIKKGADIFTTDEDKFTTGMFAARDGRVNVLKWLIEDNGLDKNFIDEKGRSVLFWAVHGGNIEAARYLLNIGASTTKYPPRELVEPCQHCGTDLPFVNDRGFFLEPCLRFVTGAAHIRADMVKLFDEYGCQLYKQLYVLSYAVRSSSVDVVKYSLSNYKYPLNNEYMVEQQSWNPHNTLLTEGCQTKSVEIVKLLLEHGADPNKNNCQKTCSSAINIAILKRHVEIIACFIRGGVNVNVKSYYPGIGAVLPFEAAVWHNHIYAAEMFLVYGSSCGVFNLNEKHKCKVDVAPDIQELLEEWNVHKNSVLPLQQRCRMVILNHLSPQADKKIPKLPLPLPLIRYLNILELDDVMEKAKKNPQNRKRKRFCYR